MRIAFLLCLVPGPASAGKLDNFASGSESAAGATARYSDSAFIDFLAEIMFDVLLYGMVQGGVASWERVDPMGADGLEMGLEPRYPGDPMIPFARLDLGYQNVESDVQAFDYRAELGFGPFGVHFNHTRYWEGEPNDQLDLYRAYGLYRMSFGNAVQLDLGFGALTMDGKDEESETGFSFSSPVLFRPARLAAIEFRPAWSVVGDIPVSDYDLAALVTWRYASFRVGYRWVISAADTLSGPTVALSLRL